MTAGPTQEPVDPVRYLSNHSSGKMGYALARVARRRGAQVTLVSGPTVLPTPRGVDVVSVRTAAEMARAVEQAFQGWLRLPAWLRLATKGIVCEPILCSG